MVKRRPVVVVSPRLKRRDGLLTVAPLSTLQPIPLMGYHCRIELPPPLLPEPYDSAVMWVKADMIYNVCFDRLELVRTGRDHTGKRKYVQRQIVGEDMTRIRQAILVGLGMPELTKYL